jgi:hypothetical protein
MSLESRIFQFPRPLYDRFRQHEYILCLPCSDNMRSRADGPRSEQWYTSVHIKTHRRYSSSCLQRVIINRQRIPEERLTHAVPSPPGPASNISFEYFNWSTGSWDSDVNDQKYRAPSSRGQEETWYPMRPDHIGEEARGCVWVRMDHKDEVDRVCATTALDVCLRLTCSLR